MKHFVNSSLVELFKIVKMFESKEQMKTIAWKGKTFSESSQINYHIEAETKWPPISWRHFQMHFPELKYINFDEDFTDFKVCSQGSNEQYSSIGSDNGLAPNRRQANI